MKPCCIYKSGNNKPCAEQKKKKKKEKLVIANGVKSSVDDGVVGVRASDCASCFCIEKGWRVTFVMVVVVVVVGACIVISFRQH